MKYDKIVNWGTKNGGLKLDNFNVMCFMVICMIPIAGQIIFLIFLGFAIYERKTYYFKRSSSTSSSAQHDIKKTKKEICEGNKQRKFEFKCICDWSKDDKYGFIPNTKCPVHGKETKLKLSKTVPYKSRKISK